jgi:hypothetical protein
MKFFEKNRDVIILLLLCLVAYQIGFGLFKIDPGNVDWIFKGRADWASHYLGWAFYRDSPWHFPLGDLDGYNYPLGTNLGLTDSIPLMAIFLKPFSFLLPQNFQYFGLWLLLCLFLNGYYALRILRLYKINEILVWLFVFLVLINPVIIYRQIHPALCAHWLFIGSLFLYLSPTTKDNVRRKLLHHLILLALSCFVTPYLTAMVFGFFIACLFRVFVIDKCLKIVPALGYLVASIITMPLLWLVIGTIGTSKKVDYASHDFFGICKMNLNALYNPIIYSKIMPERPLVTGFQEDAIMYLGVGIMVLCVAALGYTIWRFTKKNHPLFRAHLIPLFLLCIGFMLFALTHQVSFNGRNIMTIPLLDKLSALGDVFRGNGRFFWPVYYAILLYTFIAVAKIKVPEKVKIGVVALALLLQMYDISPIFNKTSFESRAYHPAVNEANWDNIYSQFDNIITVMPFETMVVNPFDYQELSFFAYRNKKNITCEMAARRDGAGIKAYTNELIQSITEGDFPMQNLYITNKENLKYFGPSFQKGLIQVENLDGYYFIYNKKKTLKKQPVHSEKERMELAQAQTANLRIQQLEPTTAPLPPAAGKIKYFIENQLVEGNIFQVSGWGFVENSTNNEGDSVFIFLKNGDKWYSSSCVMKQRKDISIVFKVGNLDNSGFECFAFTENVPKGKYELTVAIKNRGNQWYYNDPITVNIGFKSTNNPVKIANSAKLTTDFKYSVDNFEYDNKTLNIRGWSAFTDADSKDSQISILLINGKDCYSVESLNEARPDVTAAKISTFNLDNSGFTAKASTAKLPQGNYKIAIRTSNKTNNKDVYVITDKTIEVGR